MITSKKIQDTITSTKELLLKNAIQIGILIVLIIIVSLFFRQGRSLNIVIKWMILLVIRS
jgi:hypothetical protein